MRWKTITLFIFFALSAALNSNADQSVLIKEEYAELKRVYRVRKAQVRSTFKTVTGQIVHCVDISKQPSLDLLPLKNQRVQAKFVRHEATNKAESRMKMGLACPDGTVPIKRSKFRDMVKRKSLLKSRHAAYQKVWEALQGRGDPQSVYKINHVVAVAVGNGGTKANFSCWKLTLGDDNALVFGWERHLQVKPTYYGSDLLLHPNVEWTGWGPNSKGCSLFVCGSWSQVSKTIEIGRPIQPVSILDGVQCDIDLEVLLDKDDWKFGYIGYF